MEFEEQKELQDEAWREQRVMQDRSHAHETQMQEIRGRTVELATEKWTNVLMFAVICGSILALVAILHG